MPLGVVAMIYEARPNVTADAAALCIKTGNAVILRGGSLAIESTSPHRGARGCGAPSAGLPADCIQSIESTDHEAADELMGLHGLDRRAHPAWRRRAHQERRRERQGARHRDRRGQLPRLRARVGRPRHGASASSSTRSAQRPGVCNAAETLLIDEAFHEPVLPQILKALEAERRHRSTATTRPARSARSTSMKPATEDDWRTEYLDLKIAVQGRRRRSTTRSRTSTPTARSHSEAIVTQDYAAAPRFLDEVDAAAVYVNASTRFTDGGEFGLGAEIGISTQKLHARGPMGLAALTSTKWRLMGSGQIRE